jgi:hypothetical protein
MSTERGIIEAHRKVWQAYTYELGIACKSYDDALAFAEVLEIDGAYEAAEAIRAHARTLGLGDNPLRIDCTHIEGESSLKKERPLPDTCVHGYVYLCPRCTT